MMLRLIADEGHTLNGGMIGTMKLYVVVVGKYGLHAALDIKLGAHHVYGEAPSAERGKQTLQHFQTRRVDQVDGLHEQIHGVKIIVTCAELEHSALENGCNQIIKRTVGPHCQTVRMQRRQAPLMAIAQTLIGMAAQLDDARVQAPVYEDEQRQYEPRTDAPIHRRCRDVGDD